MFWEVKKQFNSTNLFRKIDVLNKNLPPVIKKIILKYSNDLKFKTSEKILKVIVLKKKKLGS